MYMYMERERERVVEKGDRNIKGEITKLVGLYILRNEFHK